ncbi:alpha-1,6-glucosidase domain-containing protein [Hymenobacter humi]|uniref:Alpha-1,6-glucosidase domain-containing protein n=1 Tax=Hymenobacter humi TaxID=1411620 RepID=A0ABW2UB96_9BACT
MFEFYRRLIALRRAHPAFRLPTTELIQQHLEFLPNLPAGTIAYRLKDHAGGDKWQHIVVLFNGNRTAVNMPIPDGKYTVVLRGDQLNEKGLGKAEQAGAALQVPANSAMILVQ